MTLARFTRRTLLSAALLNAAAPAQTRNTNQTQDTPTTTAAPTPSTASVKLSFVVTDEKGRAVADLRQEEFRVFENGEPQTVTSFTTEPAPLTYALVVDNSGSLRSQMNTVVETAEAVVAANRAGDETAVIRFVAANNITLMQDFTSDPRLLERALQELYVEGGQTAVLDAVYVAVQHLNKRRTDEPNRRRAVILVTDGEERGSTVSRDELLALLRKYDVQVFSVGLVDLLNNAGAFLRRSPREKSVELLELLAAETGGRAFFPKKASELPSVVADITNHLRAQYVISYTPTNAAHDGSVRKVKVTVAEAPGRGKLTARARATYKAPGLSDKEKKKREEEAKKN